MSQGASLNCMGTISTELKSLTNSPYLIHPHSARFHLLVNWMRLCQTKTDPLHLRSQVPQVHCLLTRSDVRPPPMIHSLFAFSTVSIFLSSLSSCSSRLLSQSDTDAHHTLSSYNSLRLKGGHCRMTLGSAGCNANAVTMENRSIDLPLSGVSNVEAPF